MVHWDPEVNNVFLDALDISDPSERRRYLDHRCHLNGALRVHVERMLAANELAGDFLESPPTEIFDVVEKIAADAIPSVGSGSVIGSYFLLEGIGEGGFGTVYLAEQREPVQRRVALKIVKPGMDSRQVITRFEAERQALAMMDHPNICRVLDCGATEAQSRFGAGRPYFVMELVDGVPITRYCDERRLGTRERLDLFSDVCHAVQHAHQKGVIHRDLKPSNILVTRVDAGGRISGPRGIPKIIDFGIAKAIEGRLTDTTIVTEQRQMLGTPTYMSPEQAGLSNLDIDTRSDIYSLGVLLYELLTATTPFDADSLRNTSYDDMRRIIREVEPPKPSTRMSSMSTAGASAQHTDSQSAVRLLRGDLDWIVMRCLEKDRTRRYETASALAADVQRHLNGEPVVAAPPSRLYRLSKTFRRHRTAAIVAASFVVLVGGGFVATSALWRAESTQRARAAAVSAFLTEMLTAAAPAKTKGERLTVGEALDTAAEHIESGQLRDQPLVEAEIRFAIGSTYFALGLLREAERQFRAANALQSRELGDEHPNTLRTRFEIGRTLVGTDYEGAARLAQATLEAQNRILGPDHLDTLRSMVLLGVARAWAGHFAEAESLLVAAIEGRRRVLGQDHAETAYFLNRLGHVYAYFTYPEKAEPLHREALRIHTQAFGEEHPDTITSTRLLANSLYNQHRPEEAEAINRKGLAISVRVLGSEHAETLGFQSDLAAGLARQGRHAEAEPIYRETLAAQMRVGGPAHFDTITTQRLLAECLAVQGKHAEAEALLREALDVAREKYGPEDGGTSISLMSALTKVLATQRKDAEAEQVARQVVEFQRRQLPRPDPGELHDSSRVLIRALQRRGANDEAARVEQELIEFLLAAAGAADANAETLYFAAADLLSPANETFRNSPQALQLAKRASERGGQQNPRYLRLLARAYMGTGDSTHAIQSWEQSFALTPNNQSRAAALNDAAWELLTITTEAARDPHKALEFALRCNELSEFQIPAQLDTLALAYHRTGDSGKASELQARAISLLAADAPDRATYEAQLREFQAASKK